MNFSKQFRPVFCSLFLTLGVLGSIFPATETMAAENTSPIEIASFTRVSDNPKNFTAEVCGLIRKSPAVGSGVWLRLILDKDTDFPRVYYAYSGSLGVFCTLVVTVKGTLDISFDGAQFSNETPVKAKISPKSKSKSNSKSQRWQEFNEGETLNN